MTPPTRRAAREAAALEAQQQTTNAKKAPSAADDDGRRRHGWRTFWIVLGAVVVVLLAATVWLAFKAIVVKDSLESAQATLSSAKDGGDAGEAVASLSEDAATAASASNDPVWRVAEFVPVAGDNLRAVRLASEALDIVVNDLGKPVLALQQDGQGKILARALPYISDSAAALEPVTTELTALTASDALIGPVRSGVDQIAAVLGGVQPILSKAPLLLGADGPQNYLMVFQNNAESLPLGGSAASQTMITADQGDLSITKQASSGDFGEDEKLTDVEIPDSAAALYGSTYGERVNMSVTRPDWPSAAEMLMAFWNRDIDDTQIDSVVSIDPIALQRVLEATGPIEVGDVTLDATNAVDILLSDSYEWWDTYTKVGSKKSDAFFAAVAATMFDKVASGDFDIAQMVKSTRESIDKGDILMWSDDADLQGTLNDTRLGGMLPTENKDATTLGVYFRDVSASKIDYYMKSKVSAKMSCSADTTTLTVTTTLHLDIDQAAADALPRYVKSRSHGSDYFSTQVFLYAPPGMTVESTSMDGDWVETFREGNVDLGRVVEPFQMRITPDETVTVTATFTGTGEYGPLDLWSTPMVNGTKVTLDDTCHG